METQRRLSLGRLIVGLLLVVLGGAWLLGNLGVMVPLDLARFWYVIPLVWGAARVAFGPDADARRGGVWILLAGLYGWVSVERIGDLSYHTAWPIFVVAGGAFMVLDALMGRTSCRRKETGDAR